MNDCRPTRGSGNDAPPVVAGTVAPSPTTLVSAAPQVHPSQGIFDSELLCISLFRRAVSLLPVTSLQRIEFTADGSGMGCMCKSVIRALQAYKSGSPLQSNHIPSDSFGPRQGEAPTRFPIQGETAGKRRKVGSTRLVGETLAPSARFWRLAD